MEDSTPEEQVKDMAAPPTEVFKRPAAYVKERMSDDDESCFGIGGIEEDHGVAGECLIDEAEEAESTTSSAGSRLLGDPCFGVANGDEETKVSSITTASYSLFC